MKKLILLLLLVSSIGYSQNTTMHFYTGSAKTLGGEILFHINNTESSYLGFGFGGAIKDKATGADLTGHINDYDTKYYVNSVKEPWCSFYTTSSTGFLYMVMIKYKLGLGVYDKKDNFDANGYLYNKKEKLLYEPLIGLSAMYDITKDVGVEVGYDTFNKGTIGFTILF